MVCLENATKALLIAAAVLIAIVLIAVGIKILSSTQGVTNSVGEVSDVMSKSVFNSQFTDYEGSQTGVQVKTLLNKVLTTHRKGSKHVVNVSGVSDIDTYRANIVINKTYTVVVKDTNNDGFVDTILIN